MATDVPQRMADGSLFVPKATQHLLSVRTVLTAETKAPRTVQLVGTVIADPNSFGRVQTGHAGRIEAPDGGLAFVGKRVKKGDLLAQLQHHIEAYNKGNLQGEIAELEERIKLQETKLARYLKAPLAIPPDQDRGDQGRAAGAAPEAQGTRAHAGRARGDPRADQRRHIGCQCRGGPVVDAREVMFEIVDPARFWVEAIAHDASVATNLDKAFAVTEHGRERSRRHSLVLGLSLKQQAAPLTFRLRRPHPT